MKINFCLKLNSLITKTFLVFALFFGFFSISHAASLVVSPGTGVYAANSTFSVQVQVKTGGQSINAAEGTLSFNPNELSVVSVNRNSSIFNLWVTEPTFSNSAGTINFSGGSPAGYSGSVGSIMSVTFRAKGSGSAKVNFSNGSVLANDGRGTNILTSMTGGTYTIQAAQITPEPEIIEYVAQPNTPGAPNVTSATHPDKNSWYSTNEATLQWNLPAGVTSLRTLFDGSPNSIPTKVYETPIDRIVLSDLDEGESYFHIQFKNAEGWGKVAHYRLGVDQTNPTDIKISTAEGTDISNPIQTLKIEVTDAVSEVRKFKIKIDNEEPQDYVDENGSSTVTLPSLEPGYHTVIVEAFDQAGNSIVGTYSFTIEAFAKPQFTEYPNQINEEVIPVIKGLTKPNSLVTIHIARIGSDESVYEINSDDKGEFVFIPEGTFSSGVYELRAQAVDEHGAKSEFSDTIRIAVQQPGYLRVGSFIVSVLSVIIPLLILSLSLIVGLWYMLRYARRFRKKVKVESLEAMQILKEEFSNLEQVLRDQESIMQKSRKTKKLTKAEAGMIEVVGKALQSSQLKVEKEIADITELTKKENK